MISAAAKSLPSKAPSSSDAKNSPPRKPEPSETIDAEHLSIKPDLVLETYIRTTPKALWDALINPDKTPLYYYGSRVDSTLRKGSPFRYTGPDGNMMLDGEVVEVVPEKRLETTFIATWVGGEPPPSTRVVYEIEPMGEVVKLTLTHYEVEKSRAGAESGWQVVLSGLKTYLETGKPLDIPMPG